MYYTIIKKYRTKYIKMIEYVLNNKEKATFECEQYITTTNIVPYDFFSDDNIKKGGDDNTNKCGDDNIKIRDFGNPIIIFNDLKSSTDLLKKFESRGLECLYVGYMHYSTQLLAEVLDLFDGKIVELLGDGHYSIIEDNINEELLKNYLIDFVEYIDYTKYYTDLEYFKDCVDSYFELRNVISDKKHDRQSLLRLLFICIFAAFNIPINEKFSKYNMDGIKFFTRVGCKQGPCKITRIEANGHIRQDKLIGSVVHEAAHQANNK